MCRRVRLSVICARRVDFFSSIVTDIARCPWTHARPEKPAYDICAQAQAHWEQNDPQGKPYQFCQDRDRIAPAGGWESLPPVYIIIDGPALCYCESLVADRRPWCDGIVASNFDSVYCVDSVYQLALAIKQADPDTTVRIRYYSLADSRLVTCTSDPAGGTDEASSNEDSQRPARYANSCDESDAGWDNAY